MYLKMPAPYVSSGVLLFDLTVVLKSSFAVIYRNIEFNKHRLMIYRQTLTILA